MGGVGVKVICDHMGPKEIIEKLNKLQSKNEALQATTELGSKPWHLFENIDDNIHELLAIIEEE